MKLPIPPRDAVVTRTVCQFCNVGCDYVAYTWPVVASGGPAADANAFGRDLSQPPGPLGAPYTPTMVHTVTGADGVRRHVAVVPAVDGPTNLRGDHSARGAANAATTFAADRRTGERLTRPLLRVGDRLVPVSWDEAEQVLARVLLGTIDRFGADAVCAKAFDHGGGGGGFENNYAVGKLLFTAIGTTMVGIHNRPSYNSEVWGSRDRGLHELHTTVDDARLCDTLVLWGANTYETATVLFDAHVLPAFRGTNDEERSRIADPGEPVEPMRVVVVDPRKTSTVELLRSVDAERVLHLRPAPGTDLVLAAAMARVALDRRWHDAAFIDARTDPSSFAAWRRDTLAEATPLAAVLAEAERLCGVPSKDIVRAAEWMHRPKGRHRRRTLTLYEKGVIWNLRNYDTVAAVVQLAMLGGHVGRPGTGCGRQGGHQEGYVRPPYPGPRPPPNVDAHLIDGGGKVLWVMGTNPYLTTLNAQRYRQRIHARTAALTAAISSPRGGEPSGPAARADAVLDALAGGDGLFLVVSELYLTDTARDAHLVLPAAGWGEAELTSINCNARRLRLADRFVDPPGEALPDWQICAQVARRAAALRRAAGQEALATRFDGFAWATAEDVFLEGGTTFPDNRVDAAGGDALPCETYTGVTYAALRAAGPAGIQTPVRRDPATGALVGTERRFQHRFGTPDGRFHWHAGERWTGYPEPIRSYLEAADTWPLWLTTGRTQRLWQTGYHDQRLEERIGEVPLPYVELHPDDAARFGLADGDLAEVWNLEGNLVAAVRVLDGPPPGMVFALQFHPFGTANDLTSPAVDPRSGNPWYKATRVAVRKLDGDLAARASTRPNNRFG